MEGDIAAKAVLWASTASNYERMGLIKRLLNVCDDKDLDNASTILTHTRRRKLKVSNNETSKPKKSKPKLTDSTLQLQPEDPINQPTTSAPTLVPVSVPSADVSLPGLGWWSDWVDEGHIKILAFDCEKVAKPDFPERCHAEYYFDKRLGIKMVKFVPNSPKEVVTFHDEAATVHICDFDEKQIYDVTVKHAPGSYTVNKWTFAINGFRYDSLKDGVGMEQARKECEAQFKDNLCIGCAMVGDFECLKLRANEYIKFDLQTEYKGPTFNNGVISLQPHSLRSIYSYYFHEAVHCGVHSASVDAKATMRIFRQGYMEDKLRTGTSLSQDRIRMYDEDEMPRIK